MQLLVVDTTTREDPAARRCRSHRNAAPWRSPGSHRSLRGAVRGAIAAALLLAAPNAFGQTTCFGKGSVLTCLDRGAGPAYQINCFGSKQYQTCLSQAGPQITLSATPASSSNGSTDAALQSSAVPGAPGGPAADPAFGAPAVSVGDPSFAVPSTAGADPLARSPQPATTPPH